MAEAELTLSEAAQLLDPPVTAEQLKLLVRAAGVAPVGERARARRGRREQTYPASVLMRLHAAIVDAMTQDS